MTITYKDAYEQFIVDYNRESEIRDTGTPQKQRFLGQKEAMSMLSKSYCYLANEYGLIDKEGTIDLVINQYEYVSGAGVSNLPKDVLYVYSVKLNDADNTPIEKTSREKMPRITSYASQRAAGLPGQYTIAVTGAGMKLIIDSTPDKNYSGDPTYRLLIYYKQKLIRYTGIASGLALSSFSNLNFATVDSWGGSFLTGSEWDDLIIMGAVAMALGPKGKDMLEEWYGMCKEKNIKKPIYVSTKPRYFLAVRK